jgi:signal transduction histidine kinase
MLSRAPIQPTESQSTQAGRDEHDAQNSDSTNMRRFMNGLAERSGMLKREREQTARLAVEVERIRLASDLDTAARGRVCEMIDLAESAGRSLASDPGRAVQAFAAIEQIGRDSLNEIRGLLGVLCSGGCGTGSPRLTSAQIETLLAEARAGGRLMQLTVEGERRTLANGVKCERVATQGDNVGWLVGKLAERAGQLEAEQDEFTRLAVRRERVRIARDLHDIVGHHLTVMVIQAGAGRMASGSHVDGAAQRFESIRQSGRHVLADMARLMDILDTDSRDTPPGGRLQLLLDEARAGGLDLHVSPVPRCMELPPAVADAAYRAVQEGLTNAIKHAPGARIYVRLSLRDDHLEVRVRDAGHTAPSTLAATGSGFGLSGMRARIESLGGCLDAGPEPSGGWCLYAQLPLAARHPRAGARDPRLPLWDDRKIAV